MVSNKLLWQFTKDPGRPRLLGRLSQCTVVSAEPNPRPRGLSTLTIPAELWLYKRPP